ncbi:MAG: hypothetical protein ABWX68_03340 [Arthrobacter sp.]|uniref:hypothetical protein n=1 Tax=Arthrobacter sp. TaxID=1667 RepID=UPI00348B3E86
MSSTPRTAPAPPSSATDLRAAHARSLTRRMLAGEGSVELTAYRAGDTLSSAVHGVSRSGQLVVADIPNLFHSLGAFHTAEDIEVRADILKDSADHVLALRLASLHLLGTLRWCRDTEEVDALGLQGHLADLVHDLGQRVRVGVVSTDRILLHDCSGVTAHGAAIVAEAATTTPPTGALNDAVLSTAGETLAAVADAVLDGGLPGWAERLDLPDAAGPAAGPAHCVDVDHRYVTLARFTGDRAWVVQVPLPSPPHASPAQDCAAAWRQLLGSLSALRMTASTP